jgi:hypothetical protein
MKKVQALAAVTSRGLPIHAATPIRKTRELRQLHGVRVITGHDPLAWDGYAKAPAYCE